MRVGFDAVRALRNATGLGNYSRGVLMALRADDASLQMTLFSSRPANPIFAELPTATRAPVVAPAGLGRRLPGWWRTFRIGHAARRLHVDLYHGLSHEIPRDVPGCGIKSVVTFHDLLFETEPQLFSPFDRRSYQWRYRWSARHADAIVAVSNTTRDELIATYGIAAGRIRVIPPVCDPAFGAPIAEADRREVLARYDLPPQFMVSVGTLETRKNQRVLLDALTMPEGASLPTLVLIGRDGGMLSPLRRELIRRGLSERVLICTRVIAADLPAIVQSAALMLFPSQREGFGMPIVEAMSAGVPVIASTAAALRDAGGDAMRTCAADDPAAWARTAHQLLSDAPARDEMIAAGRLQAARCSPARVAAELRALYDAVMTNALPNVSPTH